MARKPSKTENESSTIPAAELPGLPAMAASANQLAAIRAEQDSMVRAVAAKLGYQLPADCTDPDLIQRDIAANMRRSVEACLEVGRGLRVLKEACEHGQFIARLDVLGIDRKVAAKFMQSAAKFSNVSSTRHLVDAIGNQTKLFEMLVLDDEQIEELELTGQTGELTLDDVATMSVKELRAKLREALATAKTREEMLDGKDKELRALKLKQGKKIVAHTDWPDALIPLTDQIAACKRDFDHIFSKLETARIKAFEVMGALPEDELPKYEAALRHVAEVYGTALETANRLYEKDQVIFAKTLGAFLED